MSIAKEKRKSQEDLLIDYNPFERNPELREALGIKEKLGQNGKFSEIVNKFADNTKSSKAKKKRNRVRSESNVSQDGVKSIYVQKFRKDERLYESVKNKL